MILIIIMLVLFVNQIINSHSESEISDTDESEISDTDESEIDSDES